MGQLCLAIEPCFESILTGGRRKIGQRESSHATHEDWSRIPKSGIHSRDNNVVIGSVNQDQFDIGCRKPFIVPKRRIVEDTRPGSRNHLPKPVLSIDKRPADRPGWIGGIRSAAGECRFSDFDEEGVETVEHVVRTQVGIDDCDAPVRAVVWVAAIGR